MRRIIWFYPPNVRGFEMPALPIFNDCSAATGFAGPVAGLGKQAFADQRRAMRFCHRDSDIGGNKVANSELAKLELA